MAIEVSFQNSPVTDSLLLGMAPDFWVAAFTLVLAIVTLVLAAATVWLATITSKVARDGSKSLLHAIQTSAHQLRAYVVLDRIDIYPPPLPGLQVNIQPVWKNAGQTPTRRGRAQTNLHLSVTELSDDFDFADSNSNPVASQILGPGQERVTRGPTISSADIELIRSQHIFCYIYGWFEYCDISGSQIRWRTEFSAQLIVSSTGFAFLNTNRFNNADEDCLRRPCV